MRLVVSGSASVHDCTRSATVAFEPHINRSCHLPCVPRKRVFQLPRWDRTVWIDLRYVLQHLRTKNDGTTSTAPSGNSRTSVASPATQRTFGW
jgi:hypothetical protein